MTVSPEKPALFELAVYFETLDMEYTHYGILNRLAMDTAILPIQPDSLGDPAFLLVSISSILTRVILTR